MNEQRGGAAIDDQFPHPTRGFVSMSEIRQELQQMTRFTREGIVRLHGFGQYLASKYPIGERVELLQVPDGLLYFSGVNFFRRSGKGKGMREIPLTYKDFVETALVVGTNVSGIIRDFQEKQLTPEDQDHYFLSDIADGELTNGDYQTLPGIIASNSTTAYYGNLS